MVEFQHHIVLGICLGLCLGHKLCKSVLDVTFAEEEGRETLQLDPLYALFFVQSLEECKSLYLTDCVMKRM